MSYKTTDLTESFEVSPEEIQAMRADVRVRFRPVDIMILVKDHQKGAHQRVRELLYQKYKVQERSVSVWLRLYQHSRNHRLPKIIVEQVFRGAL